MATHRVALVQMILLILLGIVLFSDTASLQKRTSDGIDSDNCYYYRVLGLKRTASHKEIKSAYRKLSFRYHQDRDMTEAEEIFYLQVSEAYTILSDEEKRKVFDNHGKHGLDMLARGIDPNQAGFGEFSGAGGEEHASFDPFSMCVAGGVLEGNHLPVDTKLVFGGVGSFPGEVASRQRRTLKGVDSDDYYKVLGLERTASQKEIKSAYRKLSLRYHYDKDMTESEEIFYGQVAEAYRILSDEGKRTVFDKHGKHGLDMFLQSMDPIHAAFGGSRADRFGGAGGG